MSTPALTPAIELEYAAPPLPPAPPSMKRAALRGSAWTISGFGAMQVLRLASQMVMTRLLFPEAFGIMAVVMVFMQGLHMFSDVGIGPAIIQSNREDAAFLNTAWTMQLGRSLILGLLCCAIAWPVARIYGQPDLLKLMPAVGLTTAIEGFNSTAFFFLNRRLAVGKRTVLEFATEFLGLGVKVGYALWSPTVWALIAGGAATVLTRVVLSHCVVPGHRNKPHWDWGAAKQLAHFGRWVFLSTALMFFANQGDRLIFARMIPLKVLGVYSNARQLSDMPYGVLIMLGATVLFPGLSSSLRGGGDFTGRYRRIRSMMSLVAGTIVLGLVVFAPAMVRVIFDARWWAAGWMIQLLAAGVWFAAMETVAGNVSLAMGDTKWLAFSSAARVVWLFAAVPAAYWIAGRWAGEEARFPWAVAAVAASDLPRYLVAACGARANGQKVFAGDVVRTLKLAAAVSAGLALTYLTRRAFGTVSRSAGFALGGAVTLASLTVWVALNRGEVREALAYVLGERAKKGVA